MKNISRMDNCIGLVVNYLIYSSKETFIYLLFYNIYSLFIYLVQILETEMRIRHVNNFRNNPS